MKSLEICGPYPVHAPQLPFSLDVGVVRTWLLSIKRVG